MGHNKLVKEFKKHHHVIAIKVPPHKTNIRKDLPPRFARDDKRHLRSIKKELRKNISETQLVIGPDTKECTKIFGQLKDFAKTKKINLILATAGGYELYDGKTGDLRRGLTEEELFEFASQKNTVTVATPLLGRGVNIKNLVKVIKTAFNPNERQESQVDGRTGRYGAKGTTVGIYNWKKICETYNLKEEEAKTTSVKKRSKRDR
jgi:preprotein translocase subunit SecA